MFNRDRIFACGTHAFNPKCSWRNIQEIGRIIKAVDGRAKCPYSPHSNVTAMMTGVNGDYYISTPIDFSSNDPAIYRMAAGATKGMHFLLLAIILSRIILFFSVNMDTKF